MRERRSGSYHPSTPTNMNIFVLPLTGWPQLKPSTPAISYAKRAPISGFPTRGPEEFSSILVVAQKSIRSWNRIVSEDCDRRLLVSQMKHGPQLAAMHGFRSALHSTEAVTEQNDLLRGIDVSVPQRSSRSATFVAMMQTAHLGERNNLACRG